MLCVMAQSAYDKDCIKSNYSELGFDNCSLYDYNSTYYQEDNCGYAIGYQDYPDGTREYLITVRGTANQLTELNGTEWWSDFNLGFSQISRSSSTIKYHYGFNQAADRIKRSLKNWNNGSVRTDKVRYVLTGHSRGAAVSNIVSAWLIDEGVKKSNLYSYNFACPDVAISDQSVFLDSNMNSIFNLNCSQDMVGQVPGVLGTVTSGSAWQALFGNVKYWGKFGQTFFWDADWDSALPATVLKIPDYHPCDLHYVPFFSWEFPLSEFKTFEEMRTIHNKNNYTWDKSKKFYDSINVFHMEIAPQGTYVSAMAVEITDNSGNIVGTVKDNVVSIVKEYVDKIRAQVIEGQVALSFEADEDLHVNVQSEEPITIGVSQENVAYNSVNNGSVYNTDSENVTIGVSPKTTAAEIPVADSSGNKIAPDKVWLLGDANSDGKVGVADAVELQKWLLGIPDSEITEWTAADIYEDNKLNAFDMVLMRQLIMQ